MTSTVPVLEIEGLRYVYPDGTPGLRDVSLRVEQGERIALIGPNGAGKSTFLLNLNGILQSQAGTVRVLGETLTEARARAIRAKIGLLFSNPDDQFLPDRPRRRRVRAVAHGPRARRGAATLTRGAGRSRHV